MTFLPSYSLTLFSHFMLKYDSSKVSVHMLLTSAKEQNFVLKHKNTNCCILIKAIMTAVRIPA